MKMEVINMREMPKMAGLKQQILRKEKKKMKAWILIIWMAKTKKCKLSIIKKRPKMMAMEVTALILML